MDSGSALISQRAATVIADRQNTILLSYASVWELQIKMALGKLQLSKGLSNVIEEQQATNGIELLQIELPHIFKLEQLRDHHRDPFDRLHIAQAMVEGLPILRQDPLIAQYQVSAVW